MSYSSKTERGIIPKDIEVYCDMFGIKVVGRQYEKGYCSLIDNRDLLKLFKLILEVQKMEK